MAVAPEVSVVIPTIGGPYLPEAIASILGQTFTNFELVIVADGVQNGSLDELAKTDARVSVVYQPHRGVSVARNVGVVASHSELIAFLDDDDVALPGRLEAEIALLRRTPDAALAHSLFQVVDASGSPLGQPRGQAIGYEDMLQHKSGICMSTVMVRREQFFVAGGFDPPQVTGQDISFYLNISSLFPLAFLPTVLSLYRLHCANASHDLWRQTLDVEPLLRKHQLRARRVGDPARAEMAGNGLKDLRRYKAQLAMRSAHQAYERGDLRRAVRDAAVSVAQSPPVLPSRAARRLLHGR
jgi:glycosyltransferase involved in cell wall biosynthesis